MNRQAFKQRMQDLKSYRENNPGKGYLDWKAQSYADGGEVGPNAGQPSLDYIEQREWLNNWLSNRTKQMANNIDFYSRYDQNYYGSNLKRQHVSPWFFQNKEKNAKNVIDEQLHAANTTPVYDYREPWIINNYKDIPSSKTFLGQRAGVQAAFIPGDNTISISPIAHDTSSILHELTHTTQNKYDIQESVVNDILEKNNQKNDKYYDNPNEVYSRMMQFRYDNKLKPQDVITKEQIEKWKNDDSIIDQDFIGRYSTNTIEDLLNTVAQNNTKRLRRYADGGTTGDPEKERFFQATGRSRSGRPLEQGLKPVFDLEDAAGMTPIGDAMSARDTYNAVRQKDWVGAGLAAVGVLPFVPGALRRAKGNVIKHAIPDMGKPSGKALQDMIDAAQVNSARRMDYLSDVGNAKNRILEDVNSVPYRSRAAMADAQFNTNYNDTYDLLNDMYEQNFFALPEVQPSKLPGSGRMSAKPSAEANFKTTGMGAGPEDFDFKVDTDKYLDPMQMATHEMNHYTDYLISRNPNTTVNNPMLKSLEKSLKKADANSIDYFRLGTEQKSYMNQLRRELKQKGVISDLDERVLPSTLENYIDKLPDSNSIKKAFKEHSSSKNYAKWFNQIPLLGIGVIGANKYFTQDEYGMQKQNKQ